MNKKIVTIGGGTGSFTVLRGLKKYPFDITAIVNTFDNGGSSGVLRDEYGILPPGDIRRCLLALADEDTEHVIRDLFSYRFENDGTLKGHNFGNILLTALTQIGNDYPNAIEKAAAILKCKGKILPVSLGDAHLYAELENGEIIKGETNIDIPKHDPFLKINKVFLNQSVEIFEKTKKAIEDADVIIIGPGDIYTSLIPNLLVSGVPDAIRKSKAQKIYICNLMTKLGETHGFTVSYFAREILKYIGMERFDYIIYNTTEIPKKYLKKYEEENKYPVEIDNNIKMYANNCIEANLFNEANVLRHNSEKIAEIINEIINTKS